MKFDFAHTRMRPFIIICYFNVELVLKKIVFLLSVACATALLYGHLPAQHIRGCEQQGASEAICVAAEWDSEKVNLLPKYDPDYNRVIAVQQAQSQTSVDKTAAIKS
ncbi:hypothetical protein [Raoultella sp. BIGb0399]